MIDETPKRLTVRDLIQEGWITPEDVEDMLGIPGVLHGAIRQHVSGPVGGYFVNQLSTGEVRGEDVIAWVEQTRVEYAVSPEAAEVWRRLQGSKPPNPKPKTVVERAADVAKVRREEGARKKRDDERAAYTAYVGILARLEKPRAGDDVLLAESMGRLQITELQIAEDAALIQKVKHRETLHAQCASAQTEAVKAREAYKAVVSRHKEEERRSFRAKLNAESHAAACGHAGYKLMRLAQQRPQLFDDTSPPVLLQ